MSWQQLTDERLDAELTAFLTDEAAHVPGIPSTAEMTSARPGRASRRRRFPQWIGGGLRVAATAAIALVVLVAVVVLRGSRGHRSVHRRRRRPRASVGRPRRRRPAPPGQAAGCPSVGHPPDFPQAAVPGLAGFDIDVGKALATRLGLLDGPVRLSVGDMLGASRPAPMGRRPSRARC